MNQQLQRKARADTVSDRFAAAIARSAPQAATGREFDALHGAWLDRKRYLFLKQGEEANALALPLVADCETGSIAAPIDSARYTSLLSEAIGRSVTESELARAVTQITGTTLAISIAGKVCELSFEDGCRVCLTDPTRPGWLLSPDRQAACFVSGSDLWLHDHITGLDRPLTRCGASLAPVGQEPQSGPWPLSYRRQPWPAALWSNDSQWILTHRLDESGLPDMDLVEPGAPHGEAIVHRFKFASPSDSLPNAQLMAINVPTGKIVAFDALPIPTANFSIFALQRAWFDAKGRPWVVVVDRYARSASLYRLDLETGQASLVVYETADDGYLDLSHHPATPPLIRVLSTGEIIWWSERNAAGHLYLYSAAGSLTNAITCGNWVVRDIVDVDEWSRTVLFTASGVTPDADPAHRVLCQVGLDGTGFAILAQSDGCDIACAPIANAISPDRRFVVLCAGNPSTGNIISVFDRTNRTLQPLDATASRNGPLPVIHRFAGVAADGETPITGVLYLPSDFDPEQSYPLVDYLYPGPQQSHAPQFAGTMNATVAQSIAALGFACLMLDTRGTPGRGRAFHQTGYGRLLEPQLDDHAAAVRQLCAQNDFLDGSRIAAIGFSAGGAAAARALIDHGDVFKAAVAVSGTHAPDRFLSFWSDKYRGPQGQFDEARDNNLSAASRLEGALLLVAGDIDETVRVEQTLAFACALARGGRETEVLIVPGAGHDLLFTRFDAMYGIWAFLLRQLRNETLPASDLVFTDEDCARYRRALSREPAT